MTLYFFKEPFKMKADTLCIHAAKNENHTTGAITTPIFQSATFAHPGVGQSTGYDYARLQNPTRETLEKTIAALEHGVDAIACATGMAATAILFELFKPGDHIIATDDLYGGSIRMFDNISIKNGLAFDYVDTSDLYALEQKITEKTRAIFIETPTNPMMRVTDIAGVKKIIGNRDILLIVDNTFLTPYFQQPFSLGADLIIHSGTKYLGGHNDTLAGFLVSNNPALSEKIRFIYKTTGACLSPFDSYLIIRGLKTLAIRMEKSQNNAIKIANWLTTHPKVKAVHYPGLSHHPDIETSKKQATGFGAMISFEVNNEKTAHQVLEKVNLIYYAESLGGVESLITYPMLQTHADVPKEQRDARGINEVLLRLSVGIENAEDLIQDLTQALS